MNTSLTKLISICIPVLNESENIFPLYARLCSVAKSLEASYSFEFIFTDNHSSDDTWEKIRILGSKDERVKGIRFASNIGFQESLLANLSHASGLAIVQIDADLQDPPEMINNFLNAWEKGFKVVSGVRISRKEGRLNSLIREFGYRIISKLSDKPIPINVGDFRLIDKVVRNKLLQSKAPRPYIRGMIASLGFQDLGIEYSRNERVANVSKFSVKSIFKLGLDGVLNHSSWPIRLSTFSGVLILFASLILSTYYLLLRIFTNDLPQGLASIHILVLFGIGMNALFLGIIGDYLNRIYIILRNEPKYIVEALINMVDRT
jgi:glycosyltransferase involved in cell wall biosynthesis